MTLILSGTDGLSDVDGSAATPAIRGADANTGMFFPAADTIAFSEGGTESMRIDSAGNLGIGTSSQNTKLQVTNASGSGTGVINTLRLQHLGTTAGDGAKIVFTAGTSTDGAGIASTGVALNSADLRFYAGGNTERMRVTSNGDLLVGKTTENLSDAGFGVAFSAGGFNAVTIVKSIAAYGTALYIQRLASAGTGTLIEFAYNNSTLGTITTNGSSVSYNTSSDYRLKENIAPMTGALDKLSALKPVTYKWKANGLDGQGFIAHELQEVMPEAVTGEKDAVETYKDEDGNEQTKIKPQGIDTSFLVATLTAAIQELNAKVETQAAKIAALESK